MKNKQVNKNKTFLVRLDIGWKKILLHQKIELGGTFKSLVEDVLGDYYGIIEPVATSVIKRDKDGK